MLTLIETGDLPLTLDQIKYNLRLELDDDSQDDLLTNYQKAALDYAENYCNRVFSVGASLEYRLPVLTRFIDLPKQINSVEKIEYYDTDNELVELSEDNYEVIKSSYTGGYVELFGTVPSSFERSAAVVMTLETGNPPESVKQAMQLLIEGYYDGDNDKNRFAVKRLLDQTNNYYI